MMMMMLSFMYSGMSGGILGTNCDQCLSMVQCCFTSTETQDGKPRTATSTLTQLLNSEQPEEDTSTICTRQSVYSLVWQSMPRSSLWRQLLILL